MDALEEILGSRAAEWLPFAAVVLASFAASVVLQKGISFLARGAGALTLRGRIVRESRWPFSLLVGAVLARWAYATFAAVPLPSESGAADPFGQGLEFALFFFFFVLVVRFSDVAVFDYFLERVQSVRVPSLLRDPIRYLLYAVVFLVLLAAEYGTDLTGVLTLSAAASFVLGFALQDTLGNFFSGLSIYFEKSFEIGDWIGVGPNVGEVTETTWRAVKMRTTRGDYVVVPNSAIAKTELVNFSKPSPLHARHLSVGVDYATPPGRAIEALLRAASGAQGVLASPPPKVRLTAFGDSSIVYEMKVWIDRFADHRDIEADVMRRVWYELKREGIGIPFPIRTVRIERQRDEGRDAEIAKASERLASIDFLAALAESERRALAERLTLETYAAGETVVRQGEPGDSLFLVWSGDAAVRISDASGESREVARLRPGESFGEMSLLTGAARGATVVAVCDLVVARIGREAFGSILAANPGVMERISRVVAERLARNQAFLDEVRREAPARRGGGDPVAEAAQWILARVKRLFR